MLKIMLYSYLLLLPFTSAHILLDQSSKDHEPLANAVLYLTEKYIGNRTNTVVVKQLCKYCTSFQQIFHWRFLDFILLNFNESFSRLLYFGENDDQHWNYNIFIIDSKDAFNDQIDQIQLKLYETNFHFLIVLTHTKNWSTAQLEENLFKIVNSGLRLHIINMVIMVENRNGDIILYRSFIYGRDCGFKIVVTQFNKFHGGKLQYDYLFPLRMSNFDNCTLRVAAFDVPPLLMFNGDKNNKTHLRDSSRLKGIDGNLLRILEETMNFRLILVFPRKKGEVFDNGTVTGSFAMLNNRTVDMLIGGMGTNDNYRTYFTPTIVYHQSPHVAVVRSGLQYSPLKQLLHPFENELWNLIIWLLLMIIALIGYTKKHANDNIYTFIIGPNSNRFAVFNLIVTMIGLPALYLPQRNFARMFILCWIFFTFVLRSIYQGKMFDSLRVCRRIPLPRSLDDLIAQRYLMITRDYDDFYPGNLTWKVQDDYTKRFAILESADDSMRIAANSILDYLAYYNKMHWQTSRLTAVNDPINLFQMVMYFKKHSRFKFAFDEKLKQLMHAGIVAHITKEYVKQEFWVMNERNMEVPQISNELLYGLYAIYAFLIGLAILAFILEILSHQCMGLQLMFGKLNFYQ